MNNISLIGRLTKEPHIQYYENQKVKCRFILAVKRDYKNVEGKYDADFIPIVVWGKIAEVITDNINKGDLIGITGFIRTSSYEKEKNIHYTFECVMRKIEFLECKRKNIGNFVTTEDLMGDYIEK